ncbi:MAG: tryptophan--tRNA ligase [Candidatus Woykebacteria bacterium RIFCSPHIGHO2_12_FULL_43_10]|nr:MAG: tryptophan--tRNA ligase [Candidatus Woykebacteria bacterium RIFCSPHIGHO2_12_FULL_43_10]
MKKRILTGDRPTGRLHLGHYVGSLKNRVSLQDQYETFVMIADVQALTDNFENPSKVRDNVREVAMDNLAVGLDSSKAKIFIQSQIPEIAELTVFFMNLVTLSRVQRNPTVKDEMKQKGYGEDVPLGFVNYPVSQAADILFLKADLVPAGEDQRPMIELARDIAAKFNHLYGQVFPEPDLLEGDFGRLVGTDGGAKMSKSLGNTIYLSDNSDEVLKKVMGMYTDPNRLHATDPGNVEGNPVFTYLDAFGNDKTKIDEYKNSYREGKVGDVEVKKYLTDVLNDFLDPIRESRKKFESDPTLVDNILRDGFKVVKDEAEKTLSEVRAAMKIDYFNN